MVRMIPPRPSPASLLASLLLYTAYSDLALANHLQNRPSLYGYPGQDEIFLERERDGVRPHQQTVRSPLSLTSPFPYKYPYYPALTATSVSPSLPPPQQRSKYDYPFPPIPTYPPPSPSISLSPTTTRPPLLPRAPAITFLDPEPQTAPRIELESPGSQDQLDDDNEDSEDSENSGDFEDPEEVDYITETEEPEFSTVEYSTVEYTTAETEDYTADYELDISENEVITEVTLGQVLDEIFSDPELPHHNRNDVPRSPQFFVPTPIPTQQPQQTEETFEIPSRDEHSFHEEFIESPEAEGSFEEHRLRDEQDLSLAEMLLHHGEEEEVHDQHGQLQTNIINILSEERPQGPKGRKVLKKRPIRIKIPAKMSENLQSITIPESLHLPNVHELPSNVEITSPPTPPPRQNLQADTEEQEARQPKALHVFSDDDEVGPRNDNIFDPNRLNLPPRHQQSGLPDDFQPIFTSETDRDNTNNRFVPQTSSNQAFSAQSLPLNTNPPPPRRPPPPPPTRSPPPPPPPQFPAVPRQQVFTPRLRRPEDYIFSPRPLVPSLPSPVQNFNFQQNPFRAQSSGFAAEENPIPTQQSFVEPQLPVRSQKAFPQQNFNQNSLSAGTQTGFSPTPPPPSGPIPSQNEQSLFQMLNREVAERPVRTKLTDAATLQNRPKSSALENLLAIAGPDWDSNLHVSKATSKVSDFQCPAVEGHFPDPEVCGVYYQCAGGTAHAQNCQPGLKWNVLINMCDWEDNVDCDFNRGLKAIPIPDTNIQELGEQQLLQQQQQQPQFQQQQQQQQQQRPFAAFTAFSF